MQTPNPSQHAQAEATDRNEPEAKPQALSDKELATVVGGLSLNFTKIEYQN